MDQISTALISKSLDALQLRYDYIAQNIANANTPGYRPVRVTFEASLRNAAANSLEAIEALQPNVGQSQSTDGDGVRLDLELATATETAMRYRALLDVLGRQASLQQAVISSGRR